MTMSKQFYKEELGKMIAENTELKRQILIPVRNMLDIIIEEFEDY